MPRIEAQATPTSAIGSSNMRVADHQQQQERQRPAPSPTMVRTLPIRRARTGRAKAASAATPL
jgi:hypothetical protein